MDPNEALRRIRNLATQIKDDGGDDPHKTAELGDELATAIEDLDRWLCRGGFLPHAWGTRA